MKNRSTRVGLSILAGGLSFVGAANATDIVVDGSYESSTNNITGVVGAGGDDNAGLDAGWTHFSTYVYSANYTQAGPPGSGQVYLRPYSGGNSSQVVSQTNTLTRGGITTAQIDNSSGQYKLSAWFSTYKDQNDYSDLTMQFLDGSMANIGSPVALGGAAFVAALPGSPDLRAWGQDSNTGLIPAGARYAAITTSSHALVNLPDGYVDLVSLDISAGFVPVQVSAVSPPNKAPAASPGAVVSITLQNGTAPLNTNSLQLKYDNGVVAPAITQSGTVTKVQYDPPGLLPPLSTHSFELVFNNSGGAAANTTNEYTFTVAPWIDIELGAPIYLESFDALAEGALPTGWSVSSATDPHTPGYDLNDYLSDAYTNWAVISRSRLDTLISSNSDFAGTLNILPNQVINNQVVTNLIDGNFIFAISDRANNEKQIQYLFTGDYNLSGHTNVYLSFHNIYTQNQDSMGSVEYSTDGGTTWLPALYMLNGPAILLDAKGNIDASNTFAAVYSTGGTAVPDADAGTLSGGHYGQYIGVNSNQWSTLGPFISARLDDNQTDSMRVEVLRLAQADNKPAVRFRFAQVGTWSWYFGIDDFGLYGITSISPPVLAAVTPRAQIAAVGNDITFSAGNALGLPPITYQWRHNGTNLPGKTTQALIVSKVQFGDAGTYDLVASNLGGSTTSAPPASLTVFNPAVMVTGQWDFNSNLVATIGRDLQFFDNTVSNDTSFGSTTLFGIADINGQPVTVMHFTPTALSWGGYKLFHNSAPNGGGTNVNQYTLIFDMYYPSGSDGFWRALWQTDPSNVSDADLFVNPGDGVGISSIYDGNVTPNAWHRIAVGFDLTGPGQAPVLTKFIDGVKVGNQTSGLSGKDDRFSVGPFGLLFADNDGDLSEGFVSSVQFSNGRRPDGFLEALGGASASKIPGVIQVSQKAGATVISWTGGVPLEAADSVSGPWSVVSNATSPYTIPSLTGAKFYRPRIP